MLEPCAGLFLSSIFFVTVQVRCSCAAAARRACSLRVDAMRLCRCRVELALTVGLRVLMLCLRASASRSRRGGKKVRKSKVALKRSLRIAVEKRVRVNLSCALAVVCATELTARRTY